MTFMHATDADVLRGIHQGVRSTFTEARVGLRCRNTVTNILSIATSKVRKQAPVLSIPADQAINLCTALHLLLAALQIRKHRQRRHRHPGRLLRAGILSRDGRAHREYQVRARGHAGSVLGPYSKWGLRETC